MRCYRVKWRDIEGREWCYLVIAENDVAAEDKIVESFPLFRCFISTENLPFDRIIHSIKF